MIDAASARMASVIVDMAKAINKQQPSAASRQPKT
jgi:hypothetical protein